MAASPELCWVYALFEMRWELICFGLLLIWSMLKMFNRLELMVIMLHTQAILTASHFLTRFFRLTRTGQRVIVGANNSCCRVNYGVGGATEKYIFACSFRVIMAAAG